MGFLVANSYPQGLCRCYGWAPDVGAIPGLKYPDTVFGMVNFWKLDWSLIVWVAQAQSHDWRIYMRTHIVGYNAMTWRLQKLVLRGLFMFHSVVSCAIPWLKHLNLLVIEFDAISKLWWVAARGALPGSKYPHTLSSVVNFYKLEGFWKRILSPVGAAHICMPEWLMRNPVIEASICKHIKLWYSA
jgi:hypothetical protein